MVRPKKHLGQHFLNDPNIAKKIASLIDNDANTVCELGPGTGMLTKHLVKNDNIKQLKLIDIDDESTAYLENTINDSRTVIINADFLKIDLNKKLAVNTTLIGNFPYNISSQIFFKVLENKSLFQSVVCMIQKEVAERIVSPPGNKTYGILSVLLQTWFDITYCFTVNETVFTPPPKVKSAVIKLNRIEADHIDFDHRHFLKVVKIAFNQRRKTLKNALKSILPEDYSNIPYLDQRAEQLDKYQFAELAKHLAIA